MTKFRRALLAIFAFVGITAGSLAVGGGASAAVPDSDVIITVSKSCVGGGWQVDYTANSVNSALPWKNMTVGWLPTINTYQANTIPFTRSTGVLPFSQVTTLGVSIDVVWNDSGDETTGSDSVPEQAQPFCEVGPTTTTASGDTTIVDISNPPTTVTPDTVFATIPPADDGTVCITDELCFEPSTSVAPTTDFPVTGSDNGGLIIGGILLAGGAGAIVVSRRKLKHV